MRHTAVLILILFLMTFGCGRGEGPSGSIEAGNAYFADEPLTWDSLQSAWSVFVGADTFIGPVFIAYGHSEGGRDRVYFSIGHVF